jgi:hypothetical protein
MASRIVRRRAVAGEAEAQRLGDSREDQGGIGDGGKRHEPDPVGVIASDLRRDPQGQPRLADAAGAGQGDQANVVLAQQGADRRRLPLSPDERGERCGEGRRGVEGHRVRLYESGRGGSFDQWRVAGGKWQGRVLRSV